tara:strand:- start:74 stop:253 length:180 start_codon:yes stop_codon:yes gene_type:complete
MVNKSELELMQRISYLEGLLIGFTDFVSKGHSLGDIMRQSAKISDIMFPVIKENGDEEE